MKLKLLFIFLIIGFNALSQVSNDEVAQKGIRSLREGNTLSSYMIFKKLYGMDNNNALYKGYLSYTYTKISLFEDSLSKENITEAKTLADAAYKADSNNYINKFAYTNTLYLEAKHTKSNKERVKLLIEIKTNLDKLINSKEVNADAYNLLAIWHRTVASFDEFEREIIKTFYKASPMGATFEQAIKMHKKAFSLNERSEYKYELALTYKSIGVEALYINTFNEGAAIHGDSSDDVFFQAKCEKGLPQLAD